MEENKELETAITDGMVYHPVFQYPDTSNIDFEYMTNILHSLKFGNSDIDGLYKKFALRNCKNSICTAKLDVQKNLPKGDFIGER